LELRAEILGHFFNLFSVSDAKVREELIAEGDSDRVVVADDSPFFHIVRTKG